MHHHSRRPVLVLQHLDADGVGFFGTWMVRQGLDFEVRNTQAGQDFPANLDGYGGLAILGGEMSANDELPSLRRAEDLIRQAFAAGKPTIGHCLGGQLMARALGCRIHPSPAPEIGWQPIVVAEDSIASEWFGHSGEHRVYQWHYEAFELPPGARCLASSDACAHQAFSIGPHLGMQFHIEVDADKVDRWCRPREGLGREPALEGHQARLHRRRRGAPARQLQVEHTLAKRGAEKLWNLINTEPFVNSLGALTGNQAMQQVKAGLKAIYLSGWQVAGDANSRRDVPRPVALPGGLGAQGRQAHQQHLHPRRPDPVERGQERRRLLRADRGRRRSRLSAACSTPSS
jgi:GMP synthase (glutamine-hydrolysing)